MHDAKQIHVLTADLCGCAKLVVVAFVHVALVRRRLKKRNVHVEVVSQLNRSHKLGELVFEVLTTGGGDHKVVFHGNSQTLAHGVTSKRALGLGQHAGGRLVRHARRNALVKAVDIPLEFLIRVLKINIRKDVTGKRRVGGVSNQTINAVSQILIVTFEGVGKMPALVALVALRINLDITTGWTKNVLIHLDGRFRITAGVGATTPISRVTGLEVGIV